VPLSLALTVGLIFLLAGFVKGVIGLGLPTVAMGVLGLVMAPAEAAALIVVPSLATNLWQMASGPELRRLWARLWPMMLAIAGGTAAAAALIGGVGGKAATTALGLTLVAYAAVGLAAPRLAVAPRAEAWAGPLAGALTGGVTAATGVFVLPAVPYLQALGLGKEALVQALGLSFTVSTIALGVGLAGEGVFDPALAGTSLLALAPALAGMALGQVVRGRIRPQLFRLCFFVGLLVLGAHLALRGVL
jgi:uncharacterized protein